MTIVQVLQVFEIVNVANTYSGRYFDSHHEDLKLELGNKYWVDLGDHFEDGVQKDIDKAHFGGWSLEIKATGSVDSEDCPLAAEINDKVDFENLTSDFIDKIDPNFGQYFKHP